MIRFKQSCLSSKIILLPIFLCCFFAQANALSGQKKDTLSHKTESAEQINPTVQLIFTDKHRLTIDFYGENIFRAFEDTSGDIIRKPEGI